MSRAKTKKPTLRQTARQKAHHWFLPSARNNFHPAALRPVGLVVFALVLAFIPTLYNLTTAGRLQVLGYAANITVGDVHALSNQERTNAGLAPLALNGALSQAAFNKAQDMFANNYWAHTSPSGLTPWSFISGVGYSYASAGENLAKNYNSSAGVVYGWMNSSSHRSNVLSSSYQEVGYAVVNGTLLGEETTLVVAMYAVPYVAPAPAPAPAPTPAPVAAAKPTAQETAPAPVAEAPVPAPATPEEVVAETQPKEETQTIKPQSEQAATTDTTSQPAPAVEGIMTFAPIKAYVGLNWGQKASLFILSVLLLLFIMKHTIIWRTRKRGLRDIWLRAHPIAQGSVLVLAMVITLLSGTGSIL